MPCPCPCLAVSIWEDPVRHLTCLQCTSGAAIPATTYLTSHVLPAIHTCHRATQWQLLALLHSATQLLAAGPLDPTAQASHQLLEGVVVAAKCPAATDATDRALLTLLDTALLAQASRVRPADVAAVVRLLRLLEAHAIARQDNCTFQGFEYGTPHLGLHVQRVPKGEIPAVLVQPGAQEDQRGSVVLPPAVAEAIGAHVPGDTVDVVQYAVVGVEGLPAAAVTLAFRCAPEMLAPEHRFGPFVGPRSRRGT